MIEGRQLLTVTEVAELFAVDRRTVTRWANIGRLSVQRTLGGHRRFFADEVDRLLRDSHTPLQEP